MFVIFTKLASEYSINPNIDYISEGFYFILSLFFIFIFVSAIILVVAIADFFTSIFHRIFKNVHFNISNKYVEIGLSVLMIFGTAILLIIYKPDINKLFPSLLPAGEFNDVMSGIWERENKILLNKVIDSLFIQFALTAVYSVPFILIKAAVPLIKHFLCDPDSESFSDLKNKGGWDYVKGSALEFLFELLAAILGNTILQLILTTNGPDFMFGSSSNKAGEIYSVLFVFLFAFVLLHAAREFVTSDYLISMTAVNVTAVLLHLPRTDHTITLLLISTLICGFSSNLLRSITSDRNGEYDSIFTEVTANTIYSVICCTLISLLCWGVWSLIDRIYPFIP